jgi:hypothetical protein
MTGTTGKTVFEQFDACRSRISPPKCPNSSIAVLIAPIGNWPYTLLYRGGEMAAPDIVRIPRQ